MKIVILDGYTTNPGDLSWEVIAAQGDLTVYDYTPPELTVERARGAEILLDNKTPLTAEVLQQLPDCRYVGLMSTGYNIIDLAQAKAQGITVTNIPAYSTHSVAETVFALLLEICRRAGLHSESVHRGDWSNGRDFCYWLSPLTELHGKTFGIVGYGAIGQAVAKIAEAFGMNVLACGNPAKPPKDGLVSFAQVLAGSDFVSLHCPLFPETVGLMNAGTLSQMKDGAVLINTSRGPVVNEADTAAALCSGKLSAFGADVLSTEPPAADNPLLSAPNTVLTPHYAWASKEARIRLLDILAANLRAYLAGKAQNTVG
ncbi:MAG: D-2-hydroxyacid dehydrogenase [Oscillospiraceae bacterium]|nr:D-2-hydroxyacid dehydrogenase [Oscillospiraceae bacterium]